MMAVTEYSAKNAYKECLYFLRGLREKGGAEKTSDIVQSYWKFQDILPTIKGIFCWKIQMELKCTRFMNW